MQIFFSSSLWISISRTSKESSDSASPKFIVTLDGVPSPLGNLADGEMELDDVRPPTKVTEATIHVNREPKVSILQRLQGVVASSDGVCVCGGGILVWYFNNTQFSQNSFQCGYKMFESHILTFCPLIGRWRDDGWGCPFKETESYGALQVLAGL